MQAKWTYLWVEIFDARRKYNPLPLAEMTRMTLLGFALTTPVVGALPSGEGLSLGEASHGMPLFKGVLSE